MHLENDFEKEKDVIEKYNALNKSVWELKLIQNHNPNLLSEDDLIKLEDAVNQKEDLANQLINLEDYPLTRKKILIVINQVKAITDSLKEGEYGFKISRSQGLMHETAIYSFIIKDIEWALELDALITSIPHYYYSQDSDFDHTLLKNKLTELMQSLVSNPPGNYIELEGRVFSCISEIKALANEDYKNLINN